MTNRYLKTIPMYFVKAGTVLEHKLYGKGVVVNASGLDGIADMQFPDGHTEYACDIKDQVKPEIFEVEAFKCPLTDNEVLAERCACLQDGIKPCIYYKADLMKKESSCTFEDVVREKLISDYKIKASAKTAEEEAIKKNKEIFDKISENLKKASFNDFLDETIKANTDTTLYVKHAKTGAKGKIEKQVADNAVLVNWKNQAPTVCTNTEIVKDTDVDLICKIKKLQEKLKKKFVKPVTDYFKKTTAAKKEPTVTTADILKKIATMSYEDKLNYSGVLHETLASKNLDIDTNSIRLDDTGNAVDYRVVKASNDIVPEEVSLKEAKEMLKDLNCSYDIINVYATLKAHTAISARGYKRTASVSVDEKELENLF